jgi:AcrR family transcriptional regulator
MDSGKNPRDLLLDKVLAYAADSGIADKSLREIAAGVGSSHRMLLYHFGSREGLTAAIVGAVEAGQRTTMAQVATRAADGGDAMRAFWAHLTTPELRPYVRLFFEVFGLAVQGTPGATAMLDDFTGSWVREGVATAAESGYALDAAAIRLGVAVSRGLLMDLLAGADVGEVTAAHELFVAMMEARQAGAG